MSLMVNENGWSRCGKGAGLDLNKKERRREEKGEEERREGLL